MAASDRDRWDTKYKDRSDAALAAPDDWLQQHARRIERQGIALDLACGLGHNAIWLAQQGWQVDAVDISPIGLRLAESLARQSHCNGISWIVADLDGYEPPPNHYDLITVFRFLDRERLPVLIESALRPGGILIYETFTQQQLLRDDNHLKNSRFTLSPGELPSLFPRLTILAHEEVDLADRRVARLVAQKS